MNDSTRNAPAYNTRSKTCTKRKEEEEDKVANEYHRYLILKWKINNVSPITPQETKELYDEWDTMLSTTFWET